MLESDEERRLFTDLYNQYGNMMLHVAKRYFPKDMYAAEDVVQNAWIRVVDHGCRIGLFDCQYEYGWKLV